VSLRCAPGRASRAVGQQTTLPNCAEPPSRRGSRHLREKDAGAPGSRPSGRESLTRRGGLDRRLELIPVGDVPPGVLAALGAEIDAVLPTRHQVAAPMDTESDDPDVLLDAVVARSGGEDGDSPRAWRLAIAADTLRSPAVGRVFGEAVVGGGCAVVGLGGLDAASGSSKTTCLHRAVKVCIHEIGHAAGLEHCADRACVMYPSRDIADVDRKDKLFCRRCARDLNHATLDAVRG
jgi:archaemetzincin